jgi:hypothetical protein
MNKRQLVFRRPVFIFHVEHYEVRLERWKKCGSVILPDNAYRFELANALLVFGLCAPMAGDRVSWSYGSVAGAVADHSRWPRVRIGDVHNRPLVRLSARSKANGDELRREQF